MNNNNLILKSISGEVIKIKVISDSITPSGITSYVTVPTFNSYTASTQTQLNSIENDINILSSISGNTLQFQNEGSNLGDNKPLTVNFTGAINANRSGDTINVNVSPNTSSGLIYMLTNINSQVSGYKQLVEINDYVAGSEASSTVNVTTTPTIIEEFITLPNNPNLNIIPAGIINIYYDVQKSSGNREYYTYIEIFKRTTGGVETLISRSENSSQIQLNTRVNVSVSAYIPTTNFNPSDLIVIKVYAVLLSGNSNISLYYDNNTDSRITIPVSINNINIPFTGATNGLNIANSNIELGGSLNKNTIIDGDGGTYGLIFDQLDNFQVTFDNFLQISDTVGDVVLNLQPSELSLQYLGRGIFSVNDNGLYIQSKNNLPLNLIASDGLLETSKLSIAASATTFTDLRSLGQRAGIEYADDYSDDFTLRSLVDAGYVINLTSQRLLTSVFNIYTGATQTQLNSINTELDLAVTGGTSLGGNAIFNNKTGRNLTFKGLVAGSNITITPSATGLTISSTGGGGGSSAASGITFNNSGTNYTGNTVQNVIEEIDRTNIVDIYFQFMGSTTYRSPVTQRIESIITEAGVTATLTVNGIPVTVGSVINQYSNIIISVNNINNLLRIKFLDI